MSCFGSGETGTLERSAYAGTIPFLGRRRSGIGDTCARSRVLSLGARIRDRQALVVLKCFNDFFRRVVKRFSS